MDCGPACLAMVASYYNKQYTVKDIKQICAVTRMGVAVQDIITGARKIGFKAAGAKLALSDLEQIPLPTILFWKQNHFVVLYKIEDKREGLAYFLADPGYGKIRLEEETMQKEWMGTSNKGIAILLEDMQEVAVHIDKQVKPRQSTYLSVIKKFLSSNKWNYSFSLVVMLLGLIANWAIPFVFQRTIDYGIGQKSMHIVTVMLLTQLVLFIGNFASQALSDVLLTRVNFRLSILLKENFLQKLMRLPIQYFDTRMNTDTLQRLNDQGKIQSFVTWKGTSIILSVLNILAFSVILWRMNAVVFFIFFILSLLSILWAAYFLKVRRVLEYSLFLRQSENSNSLYEFIMNMPEIKINDAQHKMINRLSGIQEKLNHLELRSLFLNMYQNLGVGFLTKFKEIISIAVCAYFIVHSELTVGVLLGISYTLGQLAYPINNLVSYLRDAQDADIAQQRINDVYGEKEENENVVSRMPEKIKDIIVADLSFKYPGTFNPFVLRNVYFEIPKNKITAIVGASGSGKTTLLKLLLSYYNLTSGEILLNNGTALTTVNSEHWRRKCGIVLQDGHVFSGTISENIAIAEECPNMTRVIEAAKIACIHDFVDGLPMKYSTRVGSTGIQLSGGQRQRILIARAVYKNPEFLFFDEATSSLDANNEKQIMENLTDFFQGKTVVIIAHRLSTVRNADQIIVLDQGKIIEQGIHNDLVANKGDYFKLISNQLELGA